MPIERMRGRYTGFKKSKDTASERLERVNTGRKRINAEGKIVDFSVSSPGKLTMVDYSERYPAQTFKTVAFETRANEFKQLKTNTPVLMMPVRLETKFYLDNDPPSLKIRIFPDQIMVEDHDERLSLNEYETGKSFWKEYKKLENRDDQQTINNLWNWFVEKVGVIRAPYIARQTLKNISSDKLRAAGEYAVSQSSVLPDKWLIVGYRNNQRVLEAYSRPIKQDLAFSPNFQNSVIKSDDLSIDPAVEWMFDFDKAVSHGMAVNITYKPARDQQEIQNIRTDGFDELYVVGIKLKDPFDGTKNLTLANGSKLIEKTLESHHYSKGAGFVPQGMPTNNTEDVDSGWSAFSPDAQSIWFREFKDQDNLNVTPPPTQENTIPCALIPEGSLPLGLLEDDKNYAVLSRALGLKTSSVLKRFEYREGFEKSQQNAMNLALWPVTWGEYLQSLFNHNDKPLLKTPVTDKVEDWFTHNLYGGTSIPCIRVGETPYGILPVQSFGAMNPDKMTDTMQRELLRILKTLLSIWMGEKDTLVQMTDNPQALNNPGEVFLDLLSRFPLPMQFYMQNMYVDDWIINPWYALCKAVATDINLSEKAAFVNEEITTNLTALNTKKFSSMQDQWDTYQNLRTEVLNKRNSYDALHRQTNSAMAAEKRDKLDDYLEAIEPLFNAMSDHSLRGHLYDILDMPRTLSNGSLDPKTPNPQMLYARFRVDIETWPEDQYVIVNRDEQTITPETYIAHLKLYIDSHLEANIELGEDPFPDAQKPLLYHLLYTAISRIILDNDETSLLLKEIVDNAKSNAGSAAFEATLKTADKNKISLLNDAINLAKKNSTTNEANNIHAVLKHTNVNDLKQASTRIKAITKQQAKDTNYPKAEMQALSNNIDSLIADAGKLGISKKKIISTNSRRKKLNDFKKSLEFLEKTPWHQLELLFQQTLSLAGWRLDAWFNSFHNHHLDTLRDAKETGLQLGAFGWVHNLKPCENEIGTTDISDGFIHAPSLNHAKTAAVLRAGWNAYKEEAASEALAVDLSSERVRLASWLFDAVRQGQDLADVLGYRFERFLHEAKLDYWIMPVRHAVLEITQEEFDPKSPVVDGMELLNIWNNQGGSSHLFSRAKKYFKETPPPITQLNEAINHIDTAVDAMGDAAIADSVHALIQGNSMRAGSSLAAINKGDVLPPELQVIKTQRSGKAFTHRTMLLQSSDETSYGWFSTAQDFSENVRAMADPEIECLIASLLKGLEHIRFNIAFVNDEGQEEHVKVITLDAMQGDKTFRLGAQDVIAMVGEQDSGHSLLEEWVLCWLCHTHSDYLQQGLQPVIISNASTDDLNETDKTRMWLDGWRDLIFQSRPLDPDDLRIADNDTITEATKIDIAHLENRAAATLNYFHDVIQRLLQALPWGLATPDNPHPIGTESPESIRALLLTLVKMDMPQALPRISPARDNETSGLYEQLWQAYELLLKRVDGLTLPNSKTGTIEQRIKNAREILQSLLGKSCKASLNFIPENASRIAESFKATQTRIGQNGAPICHEWLEKMQYVEPKIRLYSEAVLVHDMMEKPPLADMIVGQWPHIEGEPWAAQSPAALSQRSYVSVLAGIGAKLDLDALSNQDSYLTGLHIHESLEYVPFAEEDTALAVHFDAPNTEAPQTMLLAMAPTGMDWDFDLMVDTLRDTFEWSKLRTIDNVEILAQHVPAIFAGQYLSPGLPLNNEEEA